MKIITNPLNSIAVVNNAFVRKDCICNNGATNCRCDTPEYLCKCHGKADSKSVNPPPGCPSEASGR